MNTKKGHEPLLYIQQPELDLPAFNMQETYLIKETKKERILDTDLSEHAVRNENCPLSEVGTVELLSTEEVISIIDENSSDNEDQIIDVQKMIAQYEEKRQHEKDELPLSNEGKQTISLKRVKSFKEMNTNEKVEYLVYFPKLLPPVPCIFITINRSIRGFLVSKIEEEIEIKTFDERLVRIHINELKDIDMIGLK